MSDLYLESDVYRCVAVIDPGVGYYRQTTYTVMLLITEECRSVFRIRDILLRIRIRILGSVPLTNGSRSVPKSSVTQDAKIQFFSYFFIVLINTDPGRCGSGSGKLVEVDNAKYL